MCKIYLIYNNSTLTLDNFIDTMLSDNHSKLNTHINNIIEDTLFYCVTIDNFFQDIYNFEIFYKNKFLIIRIIQKEEKQLLITRIFYLPDINIYNISHIYKNNYVKIKIPKIII